MIYYDPSESRSGTRLQQDVIDAGHPLPNLELLTGADLLVTPFDERINIPTPIAKQIDENSVYIIGMLENSELSEIAKELSIPLPVIISANKLYNVCKYGILIQRKSGTDFTSSIPKLSEILGRMTLWTPDPWLLISANIGCNKDGKAIIDGKESGFTHKQVVSAKMSWMLRGGSVIEISRDNLTSHVIESAERKLNEFKTEKSKFIVRQKWSRQNIIGANDPRWQWMNVLTQFSGIGQKRAKAIADYCGTLVDAMIFLSDTDAVKALGQPDIARVSDSEKFRKLIGVADGNILSMEGIIGRENE